MDARKGLAYVEEMMECYRNTEIPYYEKEMELMGFIQREIKAFIAQENL